MVPELFCCRVPLATVQRPFPFCHTPTNSVEKNTHTRLTRKLIWLSIVLVCVCFVFSCAVRAQSNSPASDSQKRINIFVSAKSLEGTIYIHKDKELTPASAVSIRLITSNPASQQLTVQSDAQGRFRMPAANVEAALLSIELGTHRTILVLVHLDPHGPPLKIVAK